MSGLFNFGGLIAMTLFAVSCSHIEADPHFWPGAKHRLRKVAPTPHLSNVVPREIQFVLPPSATKSDWKLISKESFAQRTYLLTVRDENHELLDSPLAPEMIIDGDAVLHRVAKHSPGSWLVTLEFTVDQSNVRIGFKYGGHRVDKFRQIPFQTYDVDYLGTNTFTNKSRVRADGKDAWRIYIELKDRRGYNIYSLNDFDFKLNLENGAGEILGPFSGINGPYFLVKRAQPGHLKYFVTVDGQRVSGTGEAEFVRVDSRRPAAQRKDCLADLAHLAQAEIPKSVEPDVAYTKLAIEIVRRFEEKADLTPETLNSTLDAFSSEACSENKIWDEARENAGNLLRNAHRRLSR